MTARILPILAATLILTACDPRTTDATSKPYDPVVYRDRLNGCEYLSTGNFYVLTPRFGVDGKQICVGVK